MSDDIAIHLARVGKMYRIFPTRIDTALDALGVARLMPWHRPKYQEFWALREIDLELKRGHRIGIIGRNGAGKSTLLKLISGNLPPTEGEIEVRGNVQALLEAGAGFHPEFTGYENIHASLTYQGLTTPEIRAATDEIAEFTELGQFLSRPFKTYSAGMQARLNFATATAVKPEILIVDEILGAGDAYFFSKSTDRMVKLVEEAHLSCSFLMPRNRFCAFVKKPSGWSVAKLSGAARQWRSSRHMRSLSIHLKTGAFWQRTAS